jgi:hypothetical protein
MRLLLWSLRHDDKVSYSCGEHHQESWSLNREEAQGWQQ